MTRALAALVRAALSFLARRDAVLALAALVALSACEGSTEVPWLVRSDDPALLEEAVIVETTVRRGGCEGVLVYRERIAKGQPGPRPQLGRGLHGFAAEARDAQCRPIARACVERDLPLRRGDRVELALTRTPAIEACDSAACVDGTCTNVDAGAIERDAGVIDAGSPVEGDAGSEPTDAGSPDDAGTDAGRACDGETWSERCFVFRSDARDWSSAEASCVAWGGHLVSLGGPEEEEFVRGIGNGAEYWIGLHDLTTDDLFTWVDGSPSSHRNWAPGEPSGNPQAHCARDQPGTGWLFRRCTEAHPYACER